VLLSRPAQVAKAVQYLALLRETEWKERGKLAALLACAADLVAHCESLCIEHLHAHSCANSAHLVVMAHLLGGPGYSLTLHGDLETYGVDHPAKMQRARFVSAVTRPLQTAILGHTDLPADRVPVIWMGVDTERFVPKPTRTPQAGKLELVTVARLNPTKGHAFALEAIKQVRDQGLDLQYSIAGEGFGREQIEAKVKELGLSSCVRLLGTLGETKVLELLQASDAFVLPSAGLGEAAPVSVMEAMAIGLPVVCSIIGGTADMITDDVDGLLVAQKDVAGLANAFQRLASDLTLRERLGKAARARAVDVFDYRVMAKKLHEVIEHKLHNGRAQ
jgi:colanic acid/amylovoran biosynthesis glycosyltransferase